MILDTNIVIEANTRISIAIIIIFSLLIQIPPFVNNRQNGSKILFFISELSALDINVDD